MHTDYLKTKKMKSVIKLYAMLIVSVFLFFPACSQHQDIHTQIKSPTVYVPTVKEKSSAHIFAPVFLITDTSQSYDKIGSPTAHYNSDGQEVISIDINQPAIYYFKKKFKTDSGEYTNHIYRIHFPKTPVSFLTAGQNVGLMVIVTVDGSEKPVLITTVHTCGCYLAIVPTSFIQKDALPKNWNPVSQSVFSETLPGMVDYESKSKPKLLIYLRSSVHRVADIQIVESDTLTDINTFSMPLVPMNRLNTIPLNGSFTSFYHEKGILKGHVKGSVKFWETIFLSLISLDFFVGTDKSYINSNETGNRFYTSLKPWNRNRSDMWHFNRFLKFWGWRL
jgi:hypothetical protein